MTAPQFVENPAVQGGKHKRSFLIWSSIVAAKTFLPPHTPYNLQYHISMWWYNYFRYDACGRLCIEPQKSLLPNTPKGLQLWNPGVCNVLVLMFESLTSITYHVQCWDIAGDVNMNSWSVSNLHLQTCLNSHSCLESLSFGLCSPFNR